MVGEDKEMRHPYLSNNLRDIRVHGLGFVDDVNLMAWGNTTRGNCDNLKRDQGT
jgi:hypothetical protein